MKKYAAIIFMFIFMCSCGIEVHDPQIDAIRDLTKEIKRGNDIQDHRNRLIEEQNNILLNKSNKEFPNIQ